MKLRRTMLGPLDARPQTTLTFAHRGYPASHVQTSAQGQTDTGHRKSAVICPRADATTSGQDTRRLLAQIRHYKVLQLEGGWAATDVCNEPTCGQNAARFRSQAASTSRC